MKEHHKELLTVNNVIIDLKRRYMDHIKRYAIGAAILFPLMFFLYAALLDMSDDVWFTVFIISMLTIMFIFPYAALGYYCYKYFTVLKNFKIETDVFIKMIHKVRFRRHHTEHYQYMIFARSGRRFQVLCKHDIGSRYNEFFVWSKTWRMDEIEFGQTAKPQDKVYLITHKGKIEYVYYEKIFKLDKELKNMISKS